MKICTQAWEFFRRPDGHYNCVQLPQVGKDSKLLSSQESLEDINCPVSMKTQMGEVEHRRESELEHR
jgi:hypothetical protein